MLRGCARGPHITIFARESIPAGFCIYAAAPVAPMSESQYWTLGSAGSLVAKVGVAMRGV